MLLPRPYSAQDRRLPPRPGTGGPALHCGTAVTTTPACWDRASPACLSSSAAAVRGHDDSSVETAHAPTAVAAQDAEPGHGRHLRAASPTEPAAGRSPPARGPSPRFTCRHPAGQRLSAWSDRDDLSGSESVERLPPLFGQLPGQLRPVPRGPVRRLTLGRLAQLHGNLLLRFGGGLKTLRRPRHGALPISLASSIEVTIGLREPDLGLLPPGRREPVHDVVSVPGRQSGQQRCAHLSGPGHTGPPERKAGGRSSRHRATTAVGSAASDPYPT